MNTYTVTVSMRVRAKDDGEAVSSFRDRVAMQDYTPDDIDVSFYDNDRGDEHAAAWESSA